MASDRPVMSSQVPVNAAGPRPAPAGPDTTPLSGPRRLGLLLILLILPVIAVCLPAIFVTLIFGQRPHPAPAAAPDVSGLRSALEFNAQGVLPPPPALAAEPLVITVRAEHVGARAGRVAALAAQYGGSVSEGLPKEGEKDLYIDVPEAASAEFRQALTAASAPGRPSTISKSSSGRPPTMSNAGLVAVTFALPDESRAFTRRLRQPRSVPPPGRLPLVLGECGGRRVAVVHTGVGDAPACRQRLEFALRGAGGAAEKPALVICSGYAGALQTGAEVGDLILGENFSAPALTADAARLLTAWRWRQGPLTTQPSVAETPAAKAALAAATGALAVDMESGWIAAACAGAGVPMLSLRVISDAANQAFPAPGHILFDAVRQRPRYVALPLWLLRHPGKIGPFVRFVRGLAPAQANLAAALEHLLANLALPCPAGTSLR